MEKNLDMIKRRIKELQRMIDINYRCISEYAAFLPDYELQLIIKENEALSEELERLKWEVA